MPDMTAIGIIPARYGSSRFPGKPLADIQGQTMIRRVYDQAKKSESLSEVVVATDDQRILTHVEGFGGKAVMTSSLHRTGTDRCQEAVQRIKELTGNPRTFDLILNIQGDEPFLDPSQIDQVVALFLDQKVTIATLVKTITKYEELDDPNVVKAVLDKRGKVILFSRSIIPFQQNVPRQEWTGRFSYFKHIGLYGFRSDVLRQITSLPDSPLEMAESLEQLRWLENGYEIYAGVTDKDPIAIDTPRDLLKLSNKPD